MLVLVYALILGVATALRSSYDEAMEMLSHMPPPDWQLTPVFHDDTITQNLEIPQYDVDTHDYVFEAPYKLEVRDWFKQIRNLLEEAAAEGHVQATVQLADVYMFGNYLTTPNYPRALELYHKVVEKQPHAHAYFMLGVLYSTGGFGEVPQDSELANLYYEFAVQNGHTGAKYVVANNYLNGYDRPHDCSMAKHYYSHLSHVAMNYLEESQVRANDFEISYDLRLSDFNGGLYGPKLSEARSTVDVHTYTHHKNTFRELTLEINDQDFVDCFFEALEHHYGGYFFEKNHTLAFGTVLECVKLASLRYERSNYRNLGAMDRLFVVMTHVLMANMYYHGYGTNRDLDSAVRYLELALKIDPTASDANLLLAEILELGPYEEGYHDPDVMKLLHRAVEAKSASAAFRVAKAAVSRLRAERLRLSPSHGEIFDLIARASNASHTEALYHWLNLVEQGATARRGIVYSCNHEVLLYRTFLSKREVSDHFFPHLRWAFNEFRYGRFKNALLGYAIAAEMGSPNAQASAAYLLYQTQPLLSLKPKKTFTQKRMDVAIRYLERASQSHTNIDATILLGDIYFNGVPSANISVDYNRAFTYYMNAAQSLSSHACYNLGYMYEYGLVPVNNSVDYFMAKRFYDASLQKLKDRAGAKKANINSVPLNLALLRLRLKYLFTHKKVESKGWFSTFKSLGEKTESEERANDLANERANERAAAHHEGGDYDVEDYELGDYLVMACMFAFFGVFFLQNVIRQFRRVGGARGEGQPPRNNFNMEFHFVAI